MRSFQLSSGLIWKLASCFCFAASNAFVHALGLHHAVPPVQMALAQTVLGFLLLLSIWHQHFSWELLRQHAPLLLLRGFFSAIAIFFWIKSLTILPFMQVTTFKLVSPFLLFVAAHFFLGERLSARKWMCLILAMTGGVLLFSDHAQAGAPNIFNVDITMLLLPLIAVIGSTAATLVGKRLSRQLSPMFMTLSLLLLTFPWFFLSSDIAQPISMAYAGYLLLMGGISAAAYFTLHKAIQLSELSDLAPVTLSRFVLGAFFSIVCFHEWPSASVYIGSFFIITAIFLVDKKRKKV